MRKKGSKEKAGYRIGLDLGIGSVGWAVIADDHIIDLGVRAFERAENAKDGKSLNLERRTARLTRRRLRRRRSRLFQVAHVMQEHGLLSDAQVFRKQQLDATNQSPWNLRVEALDQCLDPLSWARVIYHVCKHRGFHWVSRADRIRSETDSEGGRVKQGLSATESLMVEKSYRTIGEMVVNEFPDSYRNKAGNYNKSLSRVLLSQELEALFAAQRSLGNAHATETLEHLIVGTGDRKTGLLWSQEPALSGEDLLKMLGKCTFEREEYRAPKASFIAERHVWLTRLNNLRISIDGTQRRLNDAERNEVINLPYTLTTKDKRVTYKRLRASLKKSKVLTSDFKFRGLPYASGGKDPESALFGQVPCWHAIRQAFSEADCEEEWNRIADMALEKGRADVLDQIAWVLSIYKEDDERQAELEGIEGLPPQVIDSLLGVSFEAFGRLSVKALNRLVPFMEQGEDYDKACIAAGYEPDGNHSGGKGRLLPPFIVGRNRQGTVLFDEDADVPRNPVVQRALNQARKVLNALVKTYGSPRSVHIELARDLSRPFEERRRIERGQADYREAREQSTKEFAGNFGREPSGRELEKWLLYREQHGKCAYSLQPLDLQRVVTDAKYVEVDHVLPYSRSMDNTRNNKVLVLIAENQRKGNQTPYEYLQGAQDSEQWQAFMNYVETNKSFRYAKVSRLLRKHFTGSEEFRERHLNDTRYICRFFKNYIEKHLEFSGSDAQRCIVVSGELTSFLRARWGCLKDRNANDRHHALDAVVVAACSHGMVQRIASYSRRGELEYAKSNYVDPETQEILDIDKLRTLESQFPKPWERFREELYFRLETDDVDSLRAGLSTYGTYSDAEVLAARPLFVSRPPRRRVGGAAHKETVYKKRMDGMGAPQVTQKIALANLKMTDLDQLVEPERNALLYTAIRERLEAFDGKANKAFTEEKPLLKPAGKKARRAAQKDGRSVEQPIVRSVTKLIRDKPQFAVRGGFALNDAIVRTDLFKKDGSFRIRPVYVSDLARGVIKNHVITRNREQEQWDEIDDSYEFEDHLYPWDLIRVKRKDKAFMGYYRNCDISTGAINLSVHDRDENIGKDGLIKGIGIQSALEIIKYDIDVLGNHYPRAKRAGDDVA